MVILRECSTCGWRGPLTGFRKRKQYRFGRMYYCLPCDRQRDKQQSEKRRENPEYRENEKKRRREQQRERRRDPEYKAKELELRRIRRQSPAVKAKEKEYWQNDSGS